MKILVTGASGFVGRMMVPKLLEHGWSVSVVGRAPTRLKQLFPGIEAFNYSDLPEKARGADLVVHLAVANNKTGLLETEMRPVNVKLALDVARAARMAGVPLFLNVSSIHALDGSISTPYAVTKREAVQRLSELQGITVLSIFLPSVYGANWSGSLEWLNRLPRWLARFLFTPLAALKPSVHIDRIVDWIVSGMPSADPQEVVLSDNQSNNPCYTAVVRGVDMLCALTIVLIFWWFLMLIWASVRLSSDGPGIFAQERVGHGKKSFVCYKFRTMIIGTREAGTHEISAQSVTHLGQFLRRTKLDELPQVWNILRNEMSLIGPRPCLPSQKELIAERDKRGVFSVKPGITGLAQIAGIDMRAPRQLAMSDARYIALRNFFLDAKIAISTVLGKGNGDRTI